VHFIVLGIIFNVVGHLGAPFLVGLGTLGAMLALRAVKIKKNDVKSGSLGEPWVAFGVPLGCLGPLLVSFGHNFGKIFLNIFRNEFLEACGT
jgi:hypothetical protein